VGTARELRSLAELLGDGVLDSTCEADPAVNIEVGADRVAEVAGYTTVEAEIRVECDTVEPDVAVDVFFRELMDGKVKFDARLDIKAS
jgi:hypothetical protein